MKELSIAEKAKRFDMVIEKLRNFYRDYDTVSRLIDVKEELANLIPELKESEDEKIRKALIKFHKSTIDVDGIKGEDVLAWLEKQGEQKETPCDKCKKEQPSHSCQDITELGRCALEKQNEQKPGYEWDAEKKELKKIEVEELTAFEEAVKDMMDDYRDAIDDNKVTTEEVKEHAAYMLSLIPLKPAEWSVEDEDMLDNIIDDYDDADEHNLVDDIGKVMWLKSLKDRYTWKPSNMELEVLRLAAEKDGTCLMGLYEQLKKLTK